MVADTFVVADIFVTCWWHSMEKYSKGKSLYSVKNVRQKTALKWRREGGGKQSRGRSEPKNRREQQNSERTNATVADERHNHSKLYN